MTDLADKLRLLAGQALPSTSYASFSVRHLERGILVSFTTDNDWNITSLALNVGYNVASNVDRVRAAGDGGRGGYRDAVSTPLVATRPLKIVLRRENPADTYAKMEGVASEWQSGDRPFDDAIYVSSPKHEDTLLAQVLNPDVRGSAFELLVNLGFSLIEIDDADGQVAATTAVGVRSGGTEDRDDRSARVFEAFDRMLTHLPKVTASGKKHAGRPLAVWSTLLMIIGGGGWLGSIPLVVGITRLLREIRDGSRIARTTDYDTEWLAVVVAFVFGIGGGFLGSKLYGLLIEARVRGTSDAHSAIAGAKIRAFGGFSVIVFFITYTLMFMFVSTPPPPVPH